MRRSAIADLRCDASRTMGDSRKPSPKAIPRRNRARSVQVHDRLQAVLFGGVEQAAVALDRLHEQVDVVEPNLIGRRQPRPRGSLAAAPTTPWPFSNMSS